MLRKKQLPRRPGHIFKQFTLKASILLHRTQFQNRASRTREMAQWVEALALRPDKVNLISR